MENEVDTTSPSFDANEHTVKPSSIRIDNPEPQTPAPVAQKASKDQRTTEKMEQSLTTTQNGTENHVEEDEILEDPSVSGFREEEAVTVFHAPISEDLWHAQLQRAGQQISQKPNGKKANTEDEAQLVGCTFSAHYDVIYISEFRESGANFFAYDRARTYKTNSIFLLSA